MTSDRGSKFMLYIVSTAELGLLYEASRLNFGSINIYV